MEADIQFGELEETPPQAQRRPDRNRHFAVAAYEAPSPADLPVFVDLDVMRDMEAHALSDTSVELGGVLLGGQYEDKEGRPFVVISDSLRAEHYESTKGSFKFTHETWAEITRQREEFPEELQMVGWYHTHPDWGVFLSSMDMFICDNFFNRPLDVALVIDPCRRDRGFFQWTGNVHQRVRRTDGFYVITSRFRRHELELYAAQLQGEHDMSNDPRLSGYPGQTGGYPAPVVHIGEQRAPWQGVAVLGMLTLQFLLVALIAWRILEPPATPPAPAPQPADQWAGQTAFLDEVLANLEIADKGLVSSLQDERRENAALKAANSGLHTQIGTLESLNEEADAKQKELNDRLRNLQLAFDQLRDDNEDRQREIAALQKRLETFQAAQTGGRDAVSGEAGESKWKWQWVGLGAVLAVLVAAGVALVVSKRQLQDEEGGFSENDQPDNGAETSPPPDHTE